MWCLRWPGHINPSQSPREVGAIISIPILQMTQLRRKIMSFAWEYKAVKSWSRDSNPGLQLCTARCALCFPKRFFSLRPHDNTMRQRLDLERDTELFNYPGHSMSISLCEGITMQCRMCVGVLLPVTVRTAHCYLNCTAWKSVLIWPLASESVDNELHYGCDPKVFEEFICEFLAERLSRKVSRKIGCFLLLGLDWYFQRLNLVKVSIWESGYRRFSKSALLVF